MASSWQSQLRSAQKTCIIQDDRRKIHYTFQNGTEMSEEYNIKTNELIIRKWKKKAELGTRQSNWEYEVGEQFVPKNLDTEGLMESTSNPIFVRNDTTSSFQWRIRNLPYPISTYNITVDDDKQTITIRTTNKKYYKKFSIPDMQREGLPLQQDSITTAHANNTLIITYKKPKEIIDMEKQLQAELKKMKASKDGDVDCTPS